VDACVVIEGFVGSGPCAFICKLAEAQAFRLLLVEQVEAEVRRALATLAREHEFDAFLGHCLIERCPHPTAAEVAAVLPLLLPVMRHLADVPIAVAVRIAQPRTFVSANVRHWPSALGVLLGGVSIQGPKEFLRDFGISI
jgi:hypothetical protein